MLQDHRDLLLLRGRLPVGVPSVEGEKEEDETKDVWRVSAQARSALICDLCEATGTPSLPVFAEVLRDRTDSEVSRRRL